MKLSKPIARVLVLLIISSACVTLWVLQTPTRQTQLIPFDEAVTGRDAWFPTLSSRLRFGASDVWRNPSKESDEAPPDVIDPIAERTFYMLKTGADVLWDRLPIHLETTLKRFPYHQIYADASAVVGDKTVFDVIEMVPESVVLDHLHGYKLRKQRAEENWGWSNSQIVHDSSDGWTTDKFKNIPMMLHAFRNAPKHCDWFIFADDDTYLLSQSLGSLLRNLNPKERIYMGSAAMLADQMTEMGERGKKLKEENDGGQVFLNFAHGGSGVIVSRGAVEALFWDEQREDDMVRKYSEDTVHTCCGDAAFAYMLREELDLGVNHNVDGNLLAPDPFQGETLATTLYAIASGAHCKQVLSWHHISPWEIQKLFDWEQSLVDRKSNADAGILFSDAYHDFVLPYVMEDRENWDNGASSEKYEWPQSITAEIKGDDDENSVEEVYPSNTKEDCKRACKMNFRCIGWKYEYLSPNNTCTLETNKVKAGNPINVFDDDGNLELSLESGWMVDRIRGLRADESCDILEYELGADKLDTESEGWYLRKLELELKNQPSIYNVSVKH